MENASEKSDNAMDDSGRTSLDQNKERQIAAVLVVGFHHAYGPIVEFCIPPLPQQDPQAPSTLEKLDLPDEWNFLPFLALPDGAHQKDEDFAYFHLPPVPGWSVAETTLFGISCNRQIPTKDLLVKTPDVTRSTVQKAVVVLARQPIFGPLRQKLAVITASWFDQKDFTRLDILHSLYDNLNNTYYGPVDDSTLYMGTSLRELVYKFKLKTLTLLKLLLLEKRILFYGYPVERLCTFEYSLISLVPGLLRSLQDSGAPDLDASERFLKKTEARELSNGNKESLLKYMGLPLRLFEKGSFFQPYLPLQQIDMLSAKDTKSFVVGATNQIFFHQKSDVNIDVLVTVENGTLEMYDPKLQNLVSPTLADRRWMEKIVKVVHDTWDQSDPSRPSQNTYLGSDDYLRARFEEYVLSLLSSMKHAQDSNLFTDRVQALDTASEEVMRDDDQERNYLNDYGMRWLMAWRETSNFRLWNQYTDHEIYEIVEPGHPGMGNLSMVDFQNALSNRFRELQVRQNLAPLRQTISKAVSGGARAVSTGRTRILKGVDALWGELEKGAQEAPRDNRRRSIPEMHDDTTSAELDRQLARLALSETNAAAISPTTPLPPAGETTPQQASRLLSNFSSFLNRKRREISQTLEEATRNNEVARSRLASGSASLAASDDDGMSAFVDVGAMLPLPESSSKEHSPKTATERKVPFNNDAFDV